jgi:hypothetical protein
MGGRSDGVVGTSQGNGVHGVGGGYGSGVYGENTGGGPGVTGVSSGVGVSGTSTNGDGVFGTGPRNGVHGRSASAGDSGVYGENTGSGYGVGGSSVSGNGMIGTAAGAPAGGGQNNGVIGRTTTPSDSGVWGDNTGSGFGVSGTSEHGTGVIGQGGWNGVQGSTANSAASGVWGANSGSGYGVGGQSASGAGIYGKGAPAGYFDGDIVVTGDVKLMNMDCAERFCFVGADRADPGTVMVIEEGGALGISHSAYDKRVAGVISGAGSLRPGIILGHQDLPDERVCLALVGTAYCKVDATYSSIEIGDLLTSSPTPGHAMKASEPHKAFGAVIGKALLPLQDGRGLVPILIALQ